MLKDLFNTSGEYDCYGTLVEFRGMHNEHFLGMVTRSLNEGHLLEVEPSGMPTIFRIRTEDVIRIM